MRRVGRMGSRACRRARATLPRPTGRRRLGSTTRPSISPRGRSGARTCNPADQAQAYYLRCAAHYARREYDDAIADCDLALSIRKRFGAGLCAARARLCRSGRARQRHRRLQHGDPARSQERGRAQRPRRGLCGARRSTTRRPPITTRRCASIPNNAEAHNNLGWELLPRQHEDDRAIAEFDRALRFKPDFALAWLNRALAANRQWRLRHRAARSRHGHPARAKLAAGLSHARRSVSLSRRRSARGRRIIPRRSSSTPPMPTLYYGRGLANAQARRFAAAIGDFTTVLALKPEFPELYFARAGAHAGLRRRGASHRRLWRRDPAAAELCRCFQQSRHALLRAGRQCPRHRRFRLPP